MFEEGGEFAPYCPASPTYSIESGEIEVERAPAPPPPPPSQRRVSSYTAVVCVRLREEEAAVWFEFLMEKRGEFYQFPQSETGNVHEVVKTLAERRMIRDIPDMEVYFRAETSGARTQLRYYQLPLRLTQNPKRPRNLVGAPRFAWLCESELAKHVQLGQPSAFGHAIAPWSLTPFHKFAPSMRFASATPPLVLYHGTHAANVSQIFEKGLMPSGGLPGMLGHGIYFARWDKACDFALHDSLNVMRAVPGVVVRCVVATGDCFTMTAETKCTCGCGRPFVDHHAYHSRGCRTVFVSDNSVGATRRAEWCVKEPSAVLVEGVFSLKK